MTTDAQFAPAHALGDDALDQVTGGIMRDAPKPPPKEPLPVPGDPPKTPLPFPPTRPTPIPTEPPRPEPRLRWWW